MRYPILAAEREGARMMSAALRQVGLNSAQREVLEVVCQHGPLTLAELGRLLQIDQLGGLLARLVGDTPSGVSVAARFPAIRGAPV